MAAWVWSPYICCKFTGLKHWLFITAFWIFAFTANGQGSAQAEVWGGYITSIKINERWSVWNDFHYVPTAFWANRHGMTYRLGNGAQVTGGYAFVLTATSFSSQLQRREHRPWAQYEIVKPWGERMGWRARLRYDRRIRDGIAGNDFSGDWVAYNRWRLMLSTRYKLRSYPNGRSLQLHLLNELLANNGRNFNGYWLDQNRTYLMLSYDMPSVRVQFGPHLRAIPSSNGDFYNYRYGFTCWVIQRFDPRKGFPEP